MFGTIRKHSAWLWWVVATLTIISFIGWNLSVGTRNGSGRGAGFGILYGKSISADEYDSAERQFKIFYLHRYKTFPDRNPNFTSADMEQQTYIRLLLAAKARQLGMYVGDEAQQEDAVQILSEFGRDGQPAPMVPFVERVLQPEGLSADDLQRYTIDDIQLDELIQSLGLAGALVPPQEASELYDRDHQDVTAQAVFFNLSNYLSQVTVKPDEIPFFYTNFMAHYRLPDRVQINYVEFDLTNYLAAAEAKAGKTNIDADVEAAFARDGMKAVPDAKTPEEAKAKLRQMDLRHYALVMAGQKATDFVRTLFAMEPVDPTNLAALARTDGLAVHTTAPFDKENGPEDFAAPPELIDKAFSLNAESPYAGPFASAEAVYVIGLQKFLPSNVPPLNEIRDTVVQDYKNYHAALKAQAAGTNFYYSAAVQMAAGKTFAQAAVSAGQTPVALPPFSLSSRELPGLEGRATLDEIKQAAFSTPPGHISPYQGASHGGFVLYVQSVLPVDEKIKQSDFPQFLAQMRRQREGEFFNLWLQNAFTHELANVPDYDEMVHPRQATRGR